MTFKPVSWLTRTVVCIYATCIYIQSVNSMSVGKKCETSKLLNFYPDCPRWPEKLIYHQHDGPIILECDVSPKNASLSWFKDGRLITANDTVVISAYTHGYRFDNVIEFDGSFVDVIDQNFIFYGAENRLEITNPVIEDTGNYTCVTDYENSRISYSGYILVRESSTVTHPRIVNTDPLNLEKQVKLGTSTNISCTFDFGSSPESIIQPVMQWRRNSEDVSDDDKYTYQHFMEGQERVLILQIHNITKNDLGDYQCYASNKEGEISQNITLQEVRATHGKSGIPTWIIIAISGGGALVVLVFLVTMILVVNKRKSKDNIEWEDPDLEHYEVPNHQIRYDVFISYSSEDEEWVKGTLFNNLKIQGYNVNVDFKDFVPGMAIAENIMDSIYKSRKTVVVMSKNFLKSMWGQFELQQAHNRAISQRKDVLVLIKYGKCKVPAKLMGKTFLDYTDKTIKPHFWQRFFDSIGKPGLDLAAVDVNGQGHLKEKKDVYIENEEDNKNVNDGNDEQVQGSYDHLIINLKNEKNKIEANQNEVNIRPKTGDHAKRLVSTESCDSQDSSIGRRVSFEEKKPLLC